MILQALKEFYDRKYTEGELPPIGFEIRELPFLIVIDDQGNFISVEDTREQSGKRLAGKAFQIPIANVRTGSNSYMTTNLLWDHIGYVLGIPKADDAKSLKLSKNQHDTWLNSLVNLPEELKQTQEIRAILRFYENNGVEQVLKSMEIEECKKIPGCNIAFKLKSKHLPVPAGDVVRKYQVSLMNSPDEDAVVGTDLVTGVTGQIVRLHHKTRINKDADSLVSFQKNSGYDSYHKEQGFNSPVTKDS